MHAFSGWIQPQDSSWSKKTRSGRLFQKFTGGSLLFCFLRNPSTVSITVHKTVYQRSVTTSRKDLNPYKHNLVNAFNLCRSFRARIYRPSFRENTPKRSVSMTENERFGPEFINPVFAITSPKRSFSVSGLGGSGAFWTPGSRICDGYQGKTSRS